ncbi:MAG: glycosyltransferase family 2 protein [Sulfolobales archaeon]
MIDRSISPILPVKNESKESIKTTLDSLEKIYSRDNFSKLYIVYPLNDQVSKKSLKEILSETKYSYPIEVVESPNTDGLKALDLNYILYNYAEEDIIGVFDADDFIDTEILTKVREAFKKGYVAVSPRVYRYRPSLLGRLVYVETVIWYDIWINILQRLNLHTPLSGEGLFVKTSVVKSLGGFPQELAEDAALSVLLGLKGYMYGYIDSYVIELAPRSIKALIKQRIRWYKGHLKIFLNLLRTKLFLKSISRIFATYIMIFTPSIIYLAPVSLEIYNLRHVLRNTQDPYSLIKYFIEDSMSLLTVPTQLINGYYNDLLRIFLASLLYSYIALLVILIYQLIKRHGRIIGLREIVSISIISIFMLPIYWLFLSIAFILSLKPSGNKWYRTERR